MRRTYPPTPEAVAGRDRIVEAAANWATATAAAEHGTPAEWLGWLVGALLEQHEVDDLNAGILERRNAPVHR